MTIENQVIYFALGAGILSVIFGAVLIKWILALPSGNDKMQEISKAIQEGSKAYLNRQYKTVFWVGP